jgi:hypothetical protein
MSTRNSSKKPSAGRQEDYLVGYGKPPKHSRFRPGQSGNPRGRPKGSRSARAIFNKIMSEPIPLSGAGRRRTMQPLELMLVNLRNRAITAKDPKAVATLLGMIEKYGVLGPAEPKRCATPVGIRFIDPKTKKAVSPYELFNKKRPKDQS